MKYTRWSQAAEKRSSASSGTRPATVPSAAPARAPGSRGPKSKITAAVTSSDAPSSR